MGLLSGLKDKFYDEVDRATDSLFTGKVEDVAQAIVQTGKDEFTATHEMDFKDYVEGFYTGRVGQSLEHMRNVYSEIDPLGTEKAKEEAEKTARAQAALQYQLGLEQRSTQLRQQSQSRLLAAEAARNRRVKMAESIVGQEIGLFDTAPVDGTNLAVNKIPVLDPVDSMGNSIPEVM